MGKITVDELKPYELSHQMLMMQRQVFSSLYKRKIVEYLLFSDEELSGRKAEIPRVAYGIIGYICLEFGIKSTSIELRVVPASLIGKNVSMCCAVASPDEMAMGKFARIYINEDIYKNGSMIDFISSLLHELGHVYQALMRARGEKVPESISKNKFGSKINNNRNFDKEWDLLKYFANPCEQGAEEFAAKKMLELLEEAYSVSNEKQRAIVECRIGLVRKQISERRRLYGIARCDYILGSITYFPYFMLKRIDECLGYHISAYRRPSNAVLDNLYNEKRGFRTKEAAQKYLRKARRVETFTGAEKLRIFDSMATIYATKLGIEPVSLTVDVDLTRSGDYVLTFCPCMEEVDFEGRKVLHFGELDVSTSMLELDGAEFIDKLVDAFVKLDKSSDFVKAVQKYKAQVVNENLTSS